jgi:hypothetical protein
MSIESTSHLVSGMGCVLAELSYLPWTAWLVGHESRSDVLLTGASSLSDAPISVTSIVLGTELRVIERPDHPY